MKIKNCMLLVAVAATLASCGKKQGGLPEDNNFPVITVGTGTAALETTYPATIKGIHDVEVRPEISGLITKVYVREGQHVNAGQVLFSLDDGTQKAAVRQAQAAVGTAQAQLNTARLTYNNNKKLFEKNVIGQYELSTAENSFSTAQAQLAQAEASLASAKEQLSYCTVVAPASGVVGDLPYKAGAYASPSTALTTVSDVSTVEVFFSVSESEWIDQVKKAGSLSAAVNALPAVKLRLADGTTYNHPGRVVKASGVIDATTGAYSLIAHFANPDHLLKSGGAGTIVVPNVANSSNRIIIPQEVCSQVQDKIFVYTVDKDNKVKYTEITIEPQNDGKTYIVTGGIKVGDRIVTKGITKLVDGQKITPVTEEQYQKNIDKAAKLAQKQSTASGFVSAMKE